MGKGSGKGCGESLVQTVLIVLNIISAVFGGLLLGLGIWISSDGDRYIKMFGELPKEEGASRHFLHACARMLQSTGTVILSTNAIAFLSVCKRNKCLLYVYAGILGGMITAELVAIILAGIFARDVETIITSGMLTALAGYNSQFTVLGTGEIEYASSDSDVLMKAIDSAQIQFECCGVYNSSDYVNTTHPVSCCPLPADSKPGKVSGQFWNTKGETTFTYEIADTACATNATAIESREGCYSKLRSFVVDRAYVMLGVGIVIFAVQFTLMIGAIYLGKKSDMGCKKDEKCEMK